MKITDLNWMQVEKYLQKDDRAVLPLGSAEQHAYLSLLVDSILSERVSWFENFPWTRLPGVEMPAEQKLLPDRSGWPRLTGERLRAFFGDGNYGGYYQRSDQEMFSIWQAGVAETRAMIEEGWDL
jgi:hypothetical protein